MAYSPLNQGAVLFGPSNDTWLYDGTWSAGPSPPAGLTPRFSAALAETSTGELLCLISDELGARIAPSYVPEVRDCAKRQRASLEKARSVLGYEPTVRLEEGLAVAVRALRARVAA